MSKIAEGLEHTTVFYGIGRYVEDMCNREHFYRESSIHIDSSKGNTDEHIITGEYGKYRVTIECLK